MIQLVTTEVTTELVTNNQYDLQSYLMKIARTGRSAGNFFMRQTYCGA